MNTSRLKLRNLVPQKHYITSQEHLISKKKSADNIRAEEEPIGSPAEEPYEEGYPELDVSRQDPRSAAARSEGRPS